MRIPIFIYISLMILGSTGCRPEYTPDRMDLEGIWTFEPPPYHGDTISIKISDNFESDLMVRTRVIMNSDSGFYEHHYVGDSMTLLKKHEEIWVEEINFIDDSTGIIRFFKLDTTKTDDASARVFGSELMFTTNSPYSMVIHNKGSNDTIHFDWISKVQLIMIQADKDSTILTKINEL